MGDRVKSEQKDNPYHILQIEGGPLTLPGLTRLHKQGLELATETRLQSSWRYTFRRRLTHGQEVFELLEERDALKTRVQDLTAKLGEPQTSPGGSRPLPRDADLVQQIADMSCQREELRASLRRSRADAHKLLQHRDELRVRVSDLAASLGEVKEKLRRRKRRRVREG